MHIEVSGRYGERTVPDLEAVFDTHVATKDLDATMVDEPSATHLPTLARVRRFYVDHLPEDVAITQVSQSIGMDPVVESEALYHFTHDRVMDTLLPGVAPTGKPVRQPMIVVPGLEDGKVDYERIYWDRASLLFQVGALDPSALPVSGEAAKFLKPDRPCNELIARAANRPEPA